MWRSDNVQVTLSFSRVLQRNFDYLAGMDSIIHTSTVLLFHDTGLWSVWTTLLLTLPKEMGSTRTKLSKRVIFHNIQEMKCLWATKLWKKIQNHQVHLKKNKILSPYHDNARLHTKFSARNMHCACWVCAVEFSRNLWLVFNKTICAHTKVSLSADNLKDSNNHTINEIFF